MLLVSAVVLSARSARAEQTPRIFPLTASAPLAPELTAAPEALTDALVLLLSGVTTDRSLGEFGQKLRCDVTVSTCLDAVARALQTGQLVYGTVAAAPGGKIKVKLVRFDSAEEGSELHQRTFTLTAKTPKRLGKQLAKVAAQMFGREPPAEPARPTRIEDLEPPPTETIDTTDGDSDGDGDGSSRGDAGASQGVASVSRRAGGVTGGTWVMIGGGAALAAGGGGLLLSTLSLRAQVQTAPRNTMTDLLRLQQLERAGRLRTQIGMTLTVAGGAVLAAGVVRAVLQRRGNDPDPRERSLALVPVEGGGAALVFSGGLR